jgi:hypothetical protein
MPADRTEIERELRAALDAEVASIGHRIAAWKFGADESPDELERRLEQIIDETRALRRPSLKVVQGGGDDAR